MSTQTQMTPYDVVNDQQAFFTEALTDQQLTWEKEKQFAIQALQSNATLFQAAANSARALQNAIINVAAVGISLNPALGHAYLVPRKPDRNSPMQVYLDISYKGLVHIATSTGAVEWVQSKLVYSNDTYRNQGVGREPFHEQNTFGEKGDLVGVYCVAKTKSGDYLTEEMDMATIEKIRRASKAENGPWKYWFEEMVRKSPVKRGSKYWPRSERMSLAASVLDEHEGTEQIVADSGSTVIQGEYSELINTQQLEQLRQEMQRLNVTESYMTNMAKVPALEQMRAERFQPAWNHLQKISRGEVHASH